MTRPSVSMLNKVGRRESRKSVVLEGAGVRVGVMVGGSWR